MSASPIPKLSRDAIVQAAVVIADREGLDAVSMRRIGADLGYSGMSLYGHVAGKEELVALMADHVLGEVPDIDPDAPWDVAIVDFFIALHAVLLDHSGVSQAYTLRPTSGPNTTRHGRQALAALTAGGLPDRLAVEAFVALSCYTMGAALYTSARAARPDPQWLGFGITGEDLATLRDHLAVRAGPEQFRSGLEHLVRGYATEIGA